MVGVELRECGAFLSVVLMRGTSELELFRVPKASEWAVEIPSLKTVLGSRWPEFCPEEY